MQNLNAREELAALNEIGRAISGGAAHGLTKLLQIIHEQTSGLMNADSFFIALYDTASASVEFKFAVEDGVRQDIGRNEWATRTRGQGLTEYVIKKKKAVLIPNDVERWMRNHNVKLVGRLPTSWMGAPLIARENLIGVIALQSYSSGPGYREDNLNVLTAIAPQAAIAIDNARLFSFQQALIASVPHPVIAVDRRGRVTHVNEAAERIVGESKGAIVGRPVMSYYWGGVEEARRVSSALDNPDVSRNIETFVRSNTNEKIPVHLSAAPIRGEMGEIIGSVAVLEDLRLTALRGRVVRLLTAIEALNSSNELQKVLDTVVIESTSLFDADAGALLLNNDRSLQPRASAGFSDEEMGNLAIATSSKALDAILERRSLVIMSIDDYRGIQSQSRSAMVIPISVDKAYIGAVLLESKEPNFFNPEAALVETFSRQAAVAISRAQLLEERDLIQTQLIRSGNSIAAGQIASGVSHEVRNGLNNIRLALINAREQLERSGSAGRNASPVIKTLTSAENETFRLAGLADRLHRFSQRLEPTKKASYINEIVKNTLDLLKGTLEAKNCKVKADLDSALSRPQAGDGNAIFVDERQIQQVIINIVLNALDASTGRSNSLIIQTSIQRNRREAEVSIRDHGIGIASSDIRHIFEPFFTTKESGTGLGLYICDLIIRENHRGRIEVSTKEGKGATFSVFLPFPQERRLL